MGIRQVVAMDYLPAGSTVKFCSPGTMCLFCCYTLQRLPNYSLAVASWYIAITKSIISVQFVKFDPTKFVALILNVNKEYQGLLAHIKRISFSWDVLGLYSINVILIPFTGDCNTAWD